MSDTHALHWKLNRDLLFPKADILVCAGDFTNCGSIKDVSSFNGFLGTLKKKYRKIICIAGNHDILFEKRDFLARSLLTNCVYLQDSQVVINGVKFYGAPWTPRFFDWAFNADRGEVIARKWAMIPDDTNVLITHGPPHGIGDMNQEGELTGDKDLSARIAQLPELKLHIAGHIHEGWGNVVVNGVRYVNASICTRNYKPTNPPILVEV